MSADTPEPNTKHAPIPMPVPREPGEYQSTTHFGQRLRDRVPDELRDRVVRECIQLGTCSGAEYAGDAGEVHQYFQFDRVIEGVRWTVIVGIVLEAFRDEDRKHLAVTVYGDEVDE